MVVGGGKGNDVVGGRGKGIGSMIVVVVGGGGGGGKGATTTMASRLLL